MPALASLERPILRTRLDSTLESTVGTPAQDDHQKGVLPGVLINIALGTQEFQKRTHKYRDADGKSDRNQQGDIEGKGADTPGFFLL